jgi:hypothetical protein
MPLRRSIVMCETNVVFAMHFYFTIQWCYFKKFYHAEYLLQNQWVNKIVQKPNCEDLQLNKKTAFVCGY